MARHAFTFLAGVAFGLANVIPGVSGGTMAVIFGVYDRLVALVADLRGRWRSEKFFILAFGLGAGAGILALSRAMEALYTAYPAQVLFFFFGVVLGGLVPIARSAWKEGVDWKSALAFLLACALAAGPAFFGAEGSAPDGALMFALYGAIAAAAMIIPGVSGSFVLMLIGAYWQVLGAVNDMNFTRLLPFGAGVLIGLVLCARLIRLLLEKFPRIAYAAIAGFVAGSLAAVYPAAYRLSDGLSAPLFGAVGLALMLLASHFSKE